MMVQVGPVGGRKLEVTVSVFPARGEAEGLVIVAHDVTESSQYQELRKEFEPPKGLRDNKTGVMTQKDLKSLTVHVNCWLENDKPVYRVEEEMVPESELEAKFKYYKETLNHNKLAMEVAPNVPWKAVVAIQDAASGAKFDEIIRLIRSPRE